MNSFVFDDLFSKDVGRALQWILRLGTQEAAVEPGGKQGADIYIGAPVRTVVLEQL